MHSDNIRISYVRINQSHVVTRFTTALARDSICADVQVLHIVRCAAIVPDASAH